MSKLKFSKGGTMKKTNPIVFLLLAALLIGGAVVVKAKFSKTGQVKTGTETKEGFSLKNALTLGKSYKCTYADEKGQSTVLVKDKKMSVKWVSNDDKALDNGGMVNDGEWIYTWGGQENKGMKYKVESLNQNQADNPELDYMKDPGKWAAEVENKYQVKCDPVLLTDNDFSPPQNIVFEDLSAMFEKMQDVQKNLPSYQPVPSIPVPSIPAQNQEQIQEEVNSEE